jgi:hypothetical protein
MVRRLLIVDVFRWDVTSRKGWMSADNLVDPCKGKWVGHMNIRRSRFEVLGGIHWAHLIVCGVLVHDIKGNVDIRRDIRLARHGRVVRVV